MSDGVIAKRYRLGRRIGSGGMGRVWLARDEVLRRNVAIKEVLLPDGLTETEAIELRMRTLREARAAARLSHPAVIKIYDVLYAEDRPWIVMEYVESRSLAQVIKDDGPLKPIQVAQIGLVLLSALTAAHDSGVLHRDVKPGNVLLAPDGRVVLTDFGLATFDDIGNQLTQSGVVHGSPQFIAPERALDGTSSPEADLWSLGATLYAAVEGKAPYSRVSSYATLTALATAPPDPPQRAGVLKPVLGGLLRRNPRSRISADDARSRLQRIVNGEPPERAIPRQRENDSQEVQSPRPGPDGRRATPPGSPTPPPRYAPRHGTAPARGSAPAQAAAGGFDGSLGPGAYRSTNYDTTAPAPPAATSGSNRPAAANDALPRRTATPADGDAGAGAPAAAGGGRRDMPTAGYAPEPAGGGVGTAYADPAEFRDDVDTDREMDLAWALDVGEPNPKRRRRSQRRLLNWRTASAVVIGLLVAAVTTVIAVRYASGTRTPIASAPPPSQRQLPPAPLQWPCPPHAPQNAAAVKPAKPIDNSSGLAKDFAYFIPADKSFQIQVLDIMNVASTGSIWCFYDPTATRFLGIQRVPVTVKSAITALSDQIDTFRSTVPGFKYTEAPDNGLMIPDRAEATFTSDGPNGQLTTAMQLFLDRHSGSAYTLAWTSTTLSWAQDAPYWNLMWTTLVRFSPKATASPSPSLNPSPSHSARPNAGPTQGTAPIPGTLPTGKTTR